MPFIKAEISFFIHIGSFYNLDLFQRGYYHVKFYLKSGSSSSPVHTFGQSAIAIYPLVIFGENSTASVYKDRNSSQSAFPKGCSSTVLIMYHKESADLNDAFEQQVQVNVDTSQLEDVFKQAELTFCAELWFAEDKESDVSDDKFQLLTSRQKRILMSPTRGLCHHFTLVFDFSHLCAVELVIQSYLTNILPGLCRSSSFSNSLHSLAAYENHASQNWKDVILGSCSPNINKRQFAIAMHCQLCQTLLSSRERMLSFWNEVSIFLSDQFQLGSGVEVANLRGLLETITASFRQLKTEVEMTKQVAEDVSTLAGENGMIFRQLCEFIHSTPKVLRHIQRKSHQIRMKRLAEAFFVQEVQIPQLLAVYDPNTIGHEAMAASVRQSPYFQLLPELPLFCRQFDGDTSNIPIIFEDVYVPLTDAQRNDCTSIPPETIVSEVAPQFRACSEEVEFIQSDRGCFPRARSVLSSGSVSFTDCASVADILLCSSSTSSSLLRHRNRILHRGQRIVLNGEPRRRSRLNLGRLYKPVRSEVSRSRGEIKLLAYRRIVDNSLECVEVDEASPAINGLMNGEDEYEEGANRQSKSLETSNIEISSQPILRRIRHQHHSERSEKGSSRQMVHAISTPNLSPWASSRAVGKTAGPAAEAVLLERCPGCGLLDLSTTSTAFDPTADVGTGTKNQRSSSLLTSLSLPSLFLHPAGVSAMNGSLPAGMQVSGSDVGLRPSMRRLKQQQQQHHRHKAMFARRPKSVNQLVSSAHIYTEDLVNFGSLSDLFTRSCQCKKSDPLRRGRRKPHSASTELCNSTPVAASPVTDFNRSRGHEAPNPPVLPSLFENRVDHEVDTDLTDSKPSETVEEFLNAISMASLPLQSGGERGREDVEAGDDTDGPTDVARWVMQNPNEGIALVQNKVTQELVRWILVHPGDGLALIRLLRENEDEGDLEDRRSLSQNFLSTYEKEAKAENSLSPINANSTECLTYAASGASAIETPCSRRERLVNDLTPGTMTFVMLKEQLKQQALSSFNYKGHLYSDFSQLSAPFPYFSTPPTKSSSVHLVICVHGLEGNCLDLRLLTMYLQLTLPDQQLEFLMSDSNHDDTFASLEQLRENLVEEIIYHIRSMSEKPTRISFIGHSLGCVLIRAAIASGRLSYIYSRLHTFLSFCGPHLGTLYSTSGLVSVGMWALQKLKKSRSLLQLRLRDHTDPRETFLYALSASEGMEHFRYILLVASPQDHYVPFHSSRIELCRAALQDPSEIGTVYMEMVANILQRIIKSGRTTVVRYDVHNEVQSSANHFIGRAAHIAVLDSDVFMEKFFCVSAAKYFRCDDNEAGLDDPSASPSSIISDFSLLVN